MGDCKPSSSRKGSGTHDRYFPKGDAGADRSRAREEISQTATRWSAARRLCEVRRARRVQRQLRPFQELLRLGALAQTGCRGCGLWISRRRCRPAEQRQHSKKAGGALGPGGDEATLVGTTRGAARAIKRSQAGQLKSKNGEANRSTPR